MTRASTHTPIEQRASIDDASPRSEREAPPRMVVPDTAGTGRIEAFSGGGFAIAITLLVIDLRVPVADELKGRGIWEALADRWPNYLSYVLSFVIVGVAWAGHRMMFSYIERRSWPGRPQHAGLAEHCVSATPRRAPW